MKAADSATVSLVKFPPAQDEVTIAAPRTAYAGAS